MRYPTSRPADDKDTPWSRLLLDYMWHRPDRQPPLTSGQLGAKLGLSRQSVNSWIRDGHTPPLHRMLEVLAKLQIPVETLRAYYLQAELPDPIPSSLIPATAAAATAAAAPANAPEPPDNAPAPRRSSPKPAQTPSEHADDPWLAMMSEVTASMRAVGMDEAAIRAVVDHIAAKRSGTDPFTRRLVAEHTPEAQPETEREGAGREGERDAYQQTRSTHQLTDRRASYPARARRKPNTRSDSV